MPILVNLKHLEDTFETIEGTLPAAELDFAHTDELIRNVGPLEYRLEVQLQAAGVLATGRLTMRLACECACCLKPFDFDLTLEDWSCLAPLEGEDRVKIHDDCVDLTPLVREDILLAFPQYPKCGTECRGLPQTPSPTQPNQGRAGGGKSGLSVWDELSKLKLQ